MGSRDANQRVHSVVGKDASNWFFLKRVVGVTYVPYRTLYHHCVPDDPSIAPPSYERSVPQPTPGFSAARTLTGLGDLRLRF